jgi:hypothetical protein
MVVQAHSVQMAERLRIQLDLRELARVTLAASRVSVGRCSSSSSRAIVTGLALKTFGPLR